MSTPTPRETYSRFPDNLKKALPKTDFATKEELYAYAEVLVRAGLGKGAGIRPGDTVLVMMNQYVAELFYPYVQLAVIKAGGHVMPHVWLQQSPSVSENSLIGLFGSADQVSHVNRKPLQIMAREAKHLLEVRSPLFPNEPNVFGGETGVKERARAMDAFIDPLQAFRQEEKGRTRTLGYFPNPALASSAEVTVKEIWQMIRTGCHLRTADPVAAVTEALTHARDICDKLNQRDIRSLRIVGKDIDLAVSLHERAFWLGGTGSNVPSYECFTTPMAKQTSGWVRVAYPIFHKGHMIRGLELWFENGRVVKWKVASGKAGMEALLSYKNADRLGEIAFTDKRLSSIKRVVPQMVLFIENLGGTGHFALGRGYRKCLRQPYRGTQRNQSNVHQDCVFTAPFTVHATLANGSEEVIYTKGSFTV